MSYEGEKGGSVIVLILCFLIVPLACCFFSIELGDEHPKPNVREGSYLALPSCIPDCQRDAKMVFSCSPWPKEAIVGVFFSFFACPKRGEAGVVFSSLPCQRELHGIWDHSAMIFSKEKEEFDVGVNCGKGREAQSSIECNDNKDFRIIIIKGEIPF